MSHYYVGRYRILPFLSFNFWLTMNRLLWPSSSWLRKTINFGRALHVIFTELDKFFSRMGPRDHKYTSTYMLVVHRTGSERRMSHKAISPIISGRVSSDFCLVLFARLTSFGKARKILTARSVRKYVLRLLVNNVAVTVTRKLEILPVIKRNYSIAREQFYRCYNERIMRYNQYMILYVYCIPVQM